MESVHDRIFAVCGGVGKLLEGKELRNIIRLARHFPGTSPFGGEIAFLTCHQVDALIAVMNREMEDQRDAEKQAQGAEVYRFRDDVVSTDIPEDV